jgi:hypothetical protein
MTPEEVYQFYGGVIKAAEAVNVARQTFHTWMRRGVIPPQQQARYEKLSKKKLKISKAQKVNSNIYFPKFRYYSPALGMCDVHSLTYLSDRSPRIIFHNPVNRQLKMASFQIENLMQAIDFYDNNNKQLYQQDIIWIPEVRIERHIISEYAAQCMGLHAGPFLIIGNTFEGKKDGY